MGFLRLRIIPAAFLGSPRPHLFNLEAAAVFHLAETCEILAAELGKSLAQWLPAGR